jgi:hypothetical protein
MQNAYRYDVIAATRRALPRESPVEAPEARDKIEAPVPAQERQRMLAAERGDP